MSGLFLSKLLSLQVDAEINNKRKRCIMKSWLIALAVLSVGLLSTTGLAFTSLPYFPLKVAFQQNGYAPPSISAEAMGSPTPGRLRDASLEDTITNGDFVIRRSAEGGNATLGDGVDEQTTWTFDFSEDPDFAAFPTADSLTSARLTLTLTPKSPHATLDIIKIEGLSGINPAQFQDIPIDTASTIQLELLDFYTSERILEILNQGGQGQIPMYYSDDAIVSLARLDLTSE
jgi:hypothetical protein